MNQSTWDFEEYGEIEFTREVFNFLIKEYYRIFGSDIMTNEPCIIFNDASADCPMLIVNQNPIRLRLVQDSLRVVEQTIFQLSHELCHYAIRQCKEDKEITLLWFEEIVCEAMSLYALQFASENWEQCTLSELDLTYSSVISNYLKTQLFKPRTDLLHRCTTVELLKQYEKIHKYERETHRNERNALYYAISMYPDECRHFCEYTKYIDTENKVTIDFPKWESDNPSPIIKELHKLQPCCNVTKEIANA